MPPIFFLLWAQAPGRGVGGSSAEVAGAAAGAGAGWVVAKVLRERAKGASSVALASPGVARVRDRGCGLAQAPSKGVGGERAGAQGGGGACRRQRPAA